MWHRKRNFYHGVTLVLSHVAELPDRLATETALIRSFRPDLNHPFVLQTLSRLRLHENRFVLPKPGTGQRFVQRTQRFRKNHLRMDFDYFLADRKLFISLYRLGSNTMHKFLEARLLRSRWIFLPQMCLRQRLCNLLDEPWRTRAMKQLRLILAFRRGAVPPSNVPLRLPPLARDVTFNKQFEIRSERSDKRLGATFLHFTFPLTASLRSKSYLGPSLSSTSGHLSELGHQVNLMLAHVVLFRLRLKSVESDRTCVLSRSRSPTRPCASRPYNLKDTSYLPNQRWKECAEKEARAWTQRWRLPLEVNGLWDEWIEHRLQEHETLLGP